MEPATLPGSHGDDRSLQPVADRLDAVLAPLGFAAGHAGAGDGRGQVIFCRGLLDGGDGACVDLVLDVEALPDWRIVDVRYWGFTDDRWHLPFDRGARLVDQLDDLAQRLPGLLA